MRLLEDRLAIHELEGAYARSFDERDGAAWSALFTADGIYQSWAEGDAPPVTFVQGTSALRDFCSSAPFDGIHMMHLPQITLDGDRATARIHLEFHGVWALQPGAPRLIMVGVYDVDYARVGGRWRIARRITTAYSRDQRTVPGYPGAAQA
ncbi:nuclear transport factor 2 family protein [Microbacterium sp. zg.Y1090]|uniref:nuclear transport factor 2 family protein n=1 Tax=Microbacterium wangruii TaxID=3049073 RepID=UPI00214D5246|nr:MULTISPECIES: nuclear transport factor 2 family protein [unclassified Microbacterium]MCR2819850.1 nuclear transport factor 2 family protein [Microbacterium sp. zg.Y1090]MDL5487961.1 nuclear transport factor 2 family protein [Microbacterium sp. zg-Y1211]WIM28593.1 nuclear transport factor 2 family protein [Microbacterium sp. zg-Y1090]